MNPEIFYITSMVVSITGIFVVWQLGLKKLRLDDFRDALFVVRDRLYELAQSDQIDCDSGAYRAVELFINSLIRYAHRFTFMSFIMSMWDYDSDKAFEGGDSPTQAMFRQVNGVRDEKVRDELISIIRAATSLLPHYIARSSLMFMLSALFYVVFRSVSPRVEDSKRQAVESFETGAYREAKFGIHAPA